MYFATLDISVVNVAISALFFFLGMMFPSNSRTTFKDPFIKKQKLEESDELESKVNDTYSILQSTVQTPVPKEKDICDIYGELIAAKLKAMDENSREICMNRIDNLLFKMKYKNNLS